MNRTEKIFLSLFVLVFLAVVGFVIVSSKNAARQQAIHPAIVLALTFWWIAC